MTFTVHKDVMVAMRDGVELATDLWVPESTPAPTLLVRLPYSKDLPALFAYGLVPNVFALVEAGYAVVYQDCRGTFRSGGEFAPMLAEPDDGADAIAWLLDQPWCDGNIGTYGPSYLGFVQWASVTASDRLRAIAPCVTTTDYYTTRGTPTAVPCPGTRSSRGRPRWRWPRRCASSAGARATRSCWPT